MASRREAAAGLVVRTRGRPGRRPHRHRLPPGETRALLRRLPRDGQRRRLLSGHRAFVHRVHAPICAFRRGCMVAGRPLREVRLCRPVRPAVSKAGDHLDAIVLAVQRGVAVGAHRKKEVPEPLRFFGQNPACRSPGQRSSTESGRRRGALMRSREHAARSPDRLTLSREPLRTGRPCNAEADLSARSVAAPCYFPSSPSFFSFGGMIARQ